MLAPNFVYATLEGYYPRLLAKDGWHEALYLPVTRDAYTVTLQLYTDKGQRVGLKGTASVGQTSPVEWEDGTTTTLTVDLYADTDTVQITFPNDSLSTARRGVARITAQTSEAIYYLYPFEVVVG